MKKKQGSKFCSCRHEVIRASAKVYVKSGPWLTTNRAEAATRYQRPVGRMVRRGDQVLFELTKYGAMLVSL